MTDKELNRISSVGRNFCSPALLEAINIVYDLYVHRLEGNTMEDFNGIAQDIIDDSELCLRFYDKETKNLYAFEVSKIDITKMIPRNNNNPLQEINYTMEGSIGLNLIGEIGEEELYQQYVEERRLFIDAYEDNVPVLNTSLNGTLPINCTVPRNITYDDYCDFINIVSLMTVIKEFIMYLAVVTNKFRINDNTMRYAYFDYGDIMWISFMITSIIRRLSGSISKPDKDGVSLRLIVASGFLDLQYRTKLHEHEKSLLRNLFPDEYNENDTVVAVSLHQQPKINFTEVGMLLVTPDLDE